jgi:predicted HAD superfamily Cof-like phosphohydrolase
MATKEQRDVKKFMQVARQDVGTTPRAPKTTHPERTALRITANLCDEAVQMLKTTPSLATLRARLIVEETGEFCDALVKGDIAEIADALADLQYVLLGAAVSFGIDLEPVWDAVHGANMEKFKQCACTQEGDGDAALRCSICNGQGYIAIRDAGGKVVKPAGWQPADIAKVLAQQTED